MKYNESLKRLRQERFGTLTNDFKSVINLTDFELNTLQKEVLCRGVDFGVPPRISEPEVLAEFELLRRQVNSFPPISLEAADRSRCEVAAVARQYATAKPDFRSFSLQREHRKVLKELRKD